MALDFGASNLFAKRNVEKEFEIKDYFKVGGIGDDADSILEFDTTKDAAILAKSNQHSKSIMECYSSTGKTNQIWWKKARGTQISPSDVAANDVIGDIYVSSWYNDKFNGLLGLRFQHISQTLVGETRMSIWTSGFERLSIDAKGHTALVSTTGALLLNRLTTVQRDALTPVNGMVIYNSTDNKFQGYENGGWANLI